ncbi:MAG: hypothetical protein J6031_04930 [Bacteroidales bacterium]|nr:hypothetical protein [Bacteroidales bacterium]
MVDKVGRASISQYIGNGVLSMEKWVVEYTLSEGDTALQCDATCHSGTRSKREWEESRQGIS